MSLRIGRALQEGIARTISRVGLLLVVVWAVLGGLNLLAYNSLLAGLVPEAPNQAMAMIGPAPAISPSTAGGAILALTVVSIVVMAAGLRTFATDERRTIPGEYLTRNLGWMFVNLVVGYLVFWIALTIGFFLVFVPGLFLLVSLYFWYVLVVVEDQNFVEAFRNAWAMARGNRWQLLALGLIVVVVASVMYGVSFGLSLLASQWLALVAYAVLVSVYSVFALATTARAYVQLADGGGAI